jgi:hypothetical protein
MAVDANFFLLMFSGSENIYELLTRQFIDVEQYVVVLFAMLGDSQVPSAHSDKIR